jgi:hypothetical protein
MEITMRRAARTASSRLSAAVVTACVWSATAGLAAPLPAEPAAHRSALTPTLVGGDWYPGDDDYYDPPEYYLPPPPVVRVVPDAPPATVYEPPVYGWLSPPRPASCGKYRYWNGEYCADARRDPPYIGPRW